MTRKRIILTSIIGTVALATLATSITLAWYGASNMLNINTFDIGIIGNSSLKISTKTDLDSFREEITNEQFKAADIDGDNRVDVYDMVFMRKKITK